MWVDWNEELPSISPDPNHQNRYLTALLAGFTKTQEELVTAQ